MSNRAAKYEQLHKVLKKHFKTQPEPGERSVLEHLIYACCLEDAKFEQADEAFAKLQQAYFDWNEVRVTTVIELVEALSSLPNASQAGHRIKRCLQSLFEARYQYDIEDMKKANLSKATEEISAWKGISPFVLNYVSQNALGGHAVPVDTLSLEVMVQCEILTAAEAEKKSLPGVERAVPKNKGFEFGSLLHQFAIEFHQHPKSAEVLAVFKEFGVTPKAKIVEKAVSKKETKPVPSATGANAHTKSTPAESSKKSTKAEPAATTKKTETPVASKAMSTTPKADAPRTPDVKSTDAKKADSKKVEATKSAQKKAEAKKVEVKKSDEKPAVKKVETKSAPKAGEKKSDATSKSGSDKAGKTAKHGPAAKKADSAKKSSGESTKPVPAKPKATSTPTKKKPR